ncbi:MAG: translation initiation factor IF-5A [archaeon]|nr:translation initiation factor IF-5A [archaeon]
MAEGDKKFGQAGQLKPGSFVLIDGNCCQVKSVEKSKPGKHGAAKARVTAMGVFDGQKRSLLKPTDTDVEIPIMLKGSAKVVAIMGDMLQIMDSESYQTYDLPIPKDIPKLAGGDDIEYQRFGDDVKITRKKAAT